MRMTRRVAFSSGHRYWIPALSEAENRSHFGQWASPYNHGHNYALEVTVEGEIEPTTGMICNIKTIDDVLKARILSQFDGKSINDEIQHFQTHASSLENLMLYIRDQLAHDAIPKEAKLVALRLYEMPELWGDYYQNGNDWTMTLTRTYEFAAAHRLHSEQLSESENIDLFGKCNNAAGHGHNYILEVTIEGRPDPKTGMMVDLAALDKTVEELVVDRYDHKNLNCDIPEFTGKTPTSEVVTQMIFERLEGKLPAKLQKVRLLETARNIFEVTASS